MNGSTVYIMEEDTKKFDNEKNIFKAIKLATIAMVFVVFTSLFDDSGGNLQASITKDLIGGRTYFIVVSTYHITNTTGQFYLDVSRQ